MLKRLNIKKQSEGFTLIELMISIAILTLLLFTGTYTYSMLLSRWDKQLGSFEYNARIARNLEVLQRVLEGVHPYIVVDNNKKPSFFFIGAQKNLLSVSHTGIFSADFPEIFQIIANKQSNGKYSLIYQAISTEKIILVGTEQIINFEKQITLFKELSKRNKTRGCRFRLLMLGSMGMNISCPSAVM